MKDYRLSEIRDTDLSELCVEGDTIRAHLENDLLLKLHEHFTDWCKIEPRDMIELPCKIATPNDIFIDWQVIWRTKEGGCIGTKSFDCEKKSGRIFGRVKKRGGVKYEVWAY